MKQYLCLAILFAACLHGRAQETDTIYYDSKWNKTDKAGKYFYRTVEKSKLKAHLLVKDFYPNGSKQMEGNYLSVDPDVRDGDFMWWYESGEPQREASFAKNNMTKLKEWSEEGKLTIEKEFVRITEKENGQNVYAALEAAPKFPGGEKALYRYIAKKIRYPLDARKKGIEGAVIIQFKVDKEGNAVEPAVIQSLYPSLDAEALRIIKEMPQWEPARQDGKYIDVKFELPINFNL